MKRPKLKKYPKKPKASASVTVQQNYLNKVALIDHQNADKVSQYKLSKTLAKRISGVKPKHHNWETVPGYTRKPGVAKHKRRVSGTKKRRTSKRRR